MNKEKYSTYLSRHLSVFIFFLVFLTASFLAVGCSQQESEQQELAAGNTKEMTLPVEGMSCNSCVASVKSTLKPMEGVEKVAVSLVDRNATITYNPEKITPAQIQKAINELGYKAGEPVVAENK
jgi:copper chaperone CopZ